MHNVCVQFRIESVGVQTFCLHRQRFHKCVAQMRELEFFFFGAVSNWVQCSIMLDSDISLCY